MPFLKVGILEVAEKWTGSEKITRMKNRMSLAKVSNLFTLSLILSILKGILF